MVGRGRHCSLLGLVLAAALAGCASQPPAGRAEPRVQQSLPAPSSRGNPPFYDVLGRRYYVMASSDGYRERGVASWYGRDFHGLTTSSGEVYDMHSMTAAHTRLPIPTWVEVTNLENGRRTVVRVNDRGPFVKDRIIDLSYAAALELDMVRKGTARVEVRALSAPPATYTADSAPPDRAVASLAGMPSSAPPPAARAPATIAVAGVAGFGGSSVPAPNLYVQAGAFSERANAASLVARLSAAGFPNPTVVSEQGGRRTLHRVRLGPVADANEFDRVRERLRAFGVADSHLVVDR
jgi:rare lipoprotein A